MTGRRSEGSRTRGASTLGCLFTLLLMAVAIYFSVNAFEVYWNYVEFRDEMRQQAQFGSQRTNDQILKALRAKADSLGLPEDARDIAVTRRPNTLTIEAEYDDEFVLPFYKRKVHFNPHAELQY